MSKLQCLKVLTAEFSNNSHSMNLSYQAVFIISDKIIPTYVIPTKEVAEEGEQ